VIHHRDAASAPPACRTRHTWARRCFIPRTAEWAGGQETRRKGSSTSVEGSSTSCSSRGLCPVQRVSCACSVCSVCVCRVVCGGVVGVGCSHSSGGHARSSAACARALLHRCPTHTRPLLHTAAGLCRETAAEGEARERRGRGEGEAREVRVEGEARERRGRGEGEARERRGIGEGEVWVARVERAQGRRGRGPSAAVSLHRGGEERRGRPCQRPHRRVAYGACRLPAMGRRRVRRDEGMRTL
jgi:hypothetical protein